MLTQDQLVNKALTGAGQVFITPDDLLLDNKRVARDIFHPAVMEYQRYRPLVVREAVTIGVDPYYIPDNAYKLIKIMRRSIMVAPTGAGYYFQDVSSQETNYSPDGRSVVCIPGPYTAEYIVPYTVNQQVVKYGLGQVFPNQPTFSVALPSAPILDTVQLSLGATTITDVGGVLDGGFLSAPCSIGPDGSMDLQIATGFSGNLLVTYSSSVPVVQELSFVDSVFIDLWEARFLTSYANPKTNIVLSELNFDVNREDILSYAKSKEDAWKAALDTNQRWWMW